MADWLMDNPVLSGGLTLMSVGGALALLRRVPAMLWAWLVRRLSITVEVPDRDPAFPWLRNWAAAQQYARRARNLSLTTVWRVDEPDPTVDSDPQCSFQSGRVSEARFLLSPAPGTHVMSYRGRLLLLNRTRRDLENGGALAFQETLTLQVFGGSRALVDELLREAHALALPKAAGVNVLTALHHCWQPTSWRPKRPLGSVVLADGLLDDVLADLRAFLQSAGWYNARGIPHRRGYLLHGPPGNGKTTLVTAVAAELGLSVATLSLSSKLMSDDTLRALVNDLPAGAVLLMEDIDCAFTAQRKTNDETGVTLSGLLNALDGVGTRDGRILFMTTNHPERLDPALVRPGRVDRSLFLGNTTADQARRLFLWFYAAGAAPPPQLARQAREFAARIPEGAVCMAAVQEHLLRHRACPEAAVCELDGDAPAGSTARAERAPDETAARPLREAIAVTLPRRL